MKKKRNEKKYLVDRTIDEQLLPNRQAIEFDQQSLFVGVNHIHARTILSTMRIFPKRMDPTIPISTTKTISFQVCPWPT